LQCLSSADAQIKLEKPSGKRRRKEDERQTDDRMLSKFTVSFSALFSFRSRAVRGKRKKKGHGDEVMISSTSSPVRTRRPSSIFAFPWSLSAAVYLHGFFFLFFFYFSK